MAEKMVENLVEERREAEEPVEALVEKSDIELNGVRIGAAIASFLLVSVVVRLISQGQTPVRILIECVLIGAVVYLLTVVVRPPAAQS